MKQWDSVDEALDFAIQNEEEAANFYATLATKAKNNVMRSVFESYQREEQGHKAKLLGVKSSGRLVASGGKVLDLKIGDYLVDVDSTGDLNYQDSLILAMKREKAAFKLYTDLADSIDDVEKKSLFLALAQEEAKHKLRFEVEYDDNILQQN